MSLLHKFRAILLLIVLVCTSFAQAGTWTGSGGSGHALLFTSMGEQLLRAFVAEPYQDNKYQARDQIDLPTFSQALASTKVIAVEESLQDRVGHPATALYMTPVEWKAIASQYSQVSQASNNVDDKNGVIVINITRFEKEYAFSPALALGTVFHEYLRAMQVPEDNYKVAAKIYSTEYFNSLLKSTPKLSAALEQDRVNKTKHEYKMDLIASEIQRAKNEVIEDQAALDAALVKRRVHVAAAKAQFNAMGDAFAEIAESASILPPVFNSKRRGKMAKLVVTMAAEGFDHQYKMSELEVATDQVSFYVNSLKKNRDFILKIRDKRSELIFEELNR